MALQTHAIGELRDRAVSNHALSRQKILKNRSTNNAFYRNSIQKPVLADMASAGDHAGLHT